MGCWPINMEHRSRNPLHLVGDPSNFSGNARRGLAVTDAVADAGGGGFCEEAFMLGAGR